MAKKVAIDEATKQEIRLRYEELVKGALTTEPAPRAEIEAALVELYKGERQEPPKEFIWFESVKAAAEYIRSKGHNPWCGCLYGQYDMFWLARLLIAEEKVGGVLSNPEEAAYLKNMTTMAKAGPWWPFDDCTVIVDTPAEIHVDASNSFHNDKGPALKHRDGHCLFYVHGREVPEKLVMAPETITVDDIVNEKNLETRRLLLDKFGVVKYAKLRGARVLDFDTYQGYPRALIRLDDDQSVWLVGTDTGTLEDGKGRVYHMAVRNTAKTCKAGHESICGFSESKVGAQS